MKISLEESWALLDVGPDAAPEEIKTKYKKLALKWCEGRWSGRASCFELRLSRAGILPPVGWAASGNGALSLAV